MNIIDVILILVILLAVWNGIVKGFLTCAAGLISWIGTLILTFWSYRYVAGLIETYVTNSVWTVPLSFLACLMIIGTVFSVLMGSVLQAIPQSVQQHSLNKLSGMIPGVISGILYAAIFAALFLLIPLSTTLSAHTRNSLMAQQLTSGLERVEQVFAPGLGEP